MSSTKPRKNCLAQWLKEYKELNSVPDIVPPKIPFESLTAEQTEIIQLVKAKLKEPVDKMLEKPLRIVLVSKAGNGKTVVLEHLKVLMETKKRQEVNFDYRIAVYTGAMALTSGTSTVHGSFKLPCRFGPAFLEKLSKGTSISPEGKSKFSKVKFILLDEMSLISIRLLQAIDLFMRGIDSKYKNFAFGNRSLLLVGDILQPKPVADVPLYYPFYQLARHAYFETSYAYYEIPNVYKLTMPIRQQGTSDEQKSFRSFLLRLRYSNTTQADVDYCRARLRENLSLEEQKMFQSKIHVFPYKKQVENHNWKAIRDCFPAEEIISVPNGFETLAICISCPIMLLKNLATEFGLTNGATGFCRDIYFQEVDGKHTNKVECIVVSIDGYTGTRFFQSRRGPGIPIFREKDRVYCEEMQEDVSEDRFPIRVFYGITQHKLQGQTLEKLCILLGPMQIYCSMDYMLFSRVRSMNDIMIVDDDISDNRFTNQSKEILAEIKVQRYELRRLNNRAIKMRSGE